MTRLEQVVDAFRWAAQQLIAEDMALEQEGDADKGLELLRKTRYCLSTDEWERLTALIQAADDPDTRSPK
jgi:HPt (histidine-containing phosphotransfer) domain-containing protein